MAYTALQLITEAYYLSGIRSRDLQNIGGSDIEDGLFRLNGLIASKTANMGHIPYFQEYIFNAIPGQEKYFIPNLIEIETLTFNINSVRYSMHEATRSEYFGTGRVDDINTLPYQWHMERSLGGADVYLYYNPQDAYVMKLWGKFFLSEVALNSDLSFSQEPYLREYFLYGLAEYLCEYFQVIIPPTITQRIKSYEQLIRDISPVDLSMQKMNYFGNVGGFNYADVNIGRGWRPVR